MSPPTTIILFRCRWSMAFNVAFPDFRPFSRSRLDGRNHEGHLTDPLLAGGIASRGPHSLSRVKALPRTSKARRWPSRTREIRAISAKRNLIMTQSIQPGRFGHSGKPDDAWLSKQGKEPILEPELPIIDTHHHLWDRGGWTYLLPELLADLITGHNIVATVFEECRSMYRANGPVEMRPVGEVEFVAGIAAMSASGGYPASRLTAIFASIGSFPSIDSVFDAHRTGPRGKSYQRRARLARTQ